MENLSNKHVFFPNYTNRTMAKLITRVRKNRSKMIPYLPKKDDLRSSTHLIPKQDFFNTDEIINNIRMYIKNPLYFDNMYLTEVPLYHYIMSMDKSILGILAKELEKYKLISLGEVEDIYNSLTFEYGIISVPLENPYIPLHQVIGNLRNK